MNFRTDKNGVIATRRCERMILKEQALKEKLVPCNGRVEIKESANPLKTFLPCVAFCTECKTWYDCRKPKLIELI